MKPFIMRNSGTAAHHSCTSCLRCSSRRSTAMAAAWLFLVIQASNIAESHTGSAAGYLIMCTLLRAGAAICPRLAAAVRAERSRRNRPRGPIAPPAQHRHADIDE